MSAYSLIIWLFRKTSVRNSYSLWRRGALANRESEKLVDGRSIGFASSCELRNQRWISLTSILSQRERRLLLLARERWDEGRWQLDFCVSAFHLCRCLLICIHRSFSRNGRFAFVRRCAGHDDSLGLTQGRTVGCDPNRRI